MVAQHLLSGLPGPKGKSALGQKQQGLGTEVSISLADVTYLQKRKKMQFSVPRTK